MVSKCLVLSGVLCALAVTVKAQYLLEDGSEVSDLEMFQECDVCPEMIVLPLGEFTMGGPPGESRENVHWGEGEIRYVTPEDPYIAYHEGPLHRVEINIPVAMGKNEVTYDQWMACVQDGGCGGYIPQDYVLQENAPRAIIRGKHPVITVSYEDALTYTEWLNKKVGADVYRLPTEAEWEYAARSGTQTPFAQGEEVTTDQVNFLGSATEIMLNEKRPDLISRGKPVPVDEMDAANGWGLRHMSGNVVEQTMSCWTERHEGWRTSSEHLKHALNPFCERRVAKGGAYPAGMDYSRLGARAGPDPSSRSSVAGFRVLRELSSEE